MGLCRIRRVLPLLLLPVKSLVLHFVLLPVLLHAQATPPPLAAWPHDQSDLKPDPAVTWGVLPNGLRFAILPNAEPPDRVSLRLFVNAGSLMEEADQQGLAHFLEHMAFNGTEHFPAGEMVEYFQRLGMAFGSHTNAHTSFHETVYKLELPNAQPATLAEGFKLFRDYAQGMLLGTAEIDKERGVILSEKRSRDSPDWRSFVNWVQFALPESLISQRLPIGIEEVISQAPRQRFVDFYRQWYVPQRMAVVAVGKVDPKEIEALIRQSFGDLANPPAPPPPPSLGSVPARGLVAHHFHDDEAPETSVSLETLRPFQLGPDTQARRARETLLRLAHSMLTRRLEILAKEEGSPLVEANAHHRDVFDLNFAEYASVDATTKPESWAAALTLIEKELRRALEFGFTNSELAEAKAVLLSQVRNQAKSAPTRKSRDLADAIANRLGMGRVFTHPADDLARVESLLQTIEPAQCLEAMRELWRNGSHLGVCASGNVTIPGGKAEILEVYRKSQAIPVEAPSQTESSAFAYLAAPAGGAIASRQSVEDLGITQLRFANEVRANLKVTDFEQNTVYVSVRVGAGRRAEPADKPGLSNLFDLAFTAGGLEAHSSDDLQRIFAGKTVDAEASVDDDAFVFTAKTTPADLLPQLELLQAYLSHPGYRPEAQRQFEKSLDPLYTRLTRTPDGILSNEVSRLIHGGDRRFGYPPREELARYTLQDLRAWVQPALDAGYLELSLAGDFTLDTAVEGIARTFGTLPPRASSKPAWSEPGFAFPAERKPHRFEYPSEIPKSFALVYWPTADMSDINRTRRLSVLASILDDRMRVLVREELGEAYSPFAHNVSSDVFIGFGYLFSMIEAAPAQVEKLTDLVAGIGSKLAAEGITQDELDRARKPILTMIEEFRRTNRYWMQSVLGRSQEQPERLAWARSFLNDFQAITKAELDQLARTFLPSGTALPVVITPAAGEKPSQP